MSALEALAEETVTKLKSAGLTLITAESCSAGALALILADAPGAGDTFHGGFVTYSKAHKTKALGVPAALLESETAVSPNVASAMAKGALSRSQADIAVAITGVVGPEPDEDGNPVGRVCIGIATRDGRSRASEYLVEEPGRESIRQAAMAQALTMVLETASAALAA